MIPYTEFISQKTLHRRLLGITPSGWRMPLFDWQKDIVRAACEVGRFAIFADCGMGKTLMQLEWAAQALAHAGGKALIVAPLAVAEQTRREAEAYGLTVKVCRDGGDLEDGVSIVNYEMLHRFSPSGITGVVLDESSILKNYSGKIRESITRFAETIPYRLCCTATPAPNDIMEIGTHAEFLGVMRRVEMLATYFVHDSGDTQKWRLKHHAVAPFFRWMSTWSVAARSPSDLGHNDSRFVLPPLNIEQMVVKSKPTPGRLFVVEASTLTERREARKTSLGDRVDVVADMVNKSDRPWVVWCDLNSESELLAKSIPDAVEVRGSDKPEKKVAALEGFANGSIRVLVTKPSIAGFGLNWQHCANVAFTGLSDSYEQFYQAVRRCWRFGQKNPVNVRVVISEAEGEVLKNIQRKEAQMNELYDQLVANMNMERRHAVCA